MAELEIDQSNLPRVQEVCQCFAVLEDGVLAHSLQEQEIEQYYTTNIQKNQLVQNDIRVAKRLQTEEEEQGAQETMLHRQTSRQLEEQDSEYARLIQEEIQRCAEETRRREREDEEIAKRIQEEEEQRTRRRSRGRDSLSDDDSGGPASASVRQRALSSPRQQQRRPTHASRCQRSTSRTRSDFTGESFRARRSDEGHHRDSRSESVETLSDDTEDSDAVFLRRPPPRISRRPNGGLLHAAPCQQRASLRLPRERNYGSLHHISRVAEEEQRGWEEEGGGGREWQERVCDLDERRRGTGGWERNGGGDDENRHRNGDNDLRQRRCSRSQSVRLQDGDRHIDRRTDRQTDRHTDRHTDRRTDRDLARTWSYRENPDKHVRFQEDGGRRRNGYHGAADAGVWEMLGQVLRDRGVAVRHGAAPPPQPQARPPPSGESRGSRGGSGSEASYGSDPRGDFQRAAPARRSYRGDATREAGRSLCGESGERGYRGEREWRRHVGLAIEEEEDGVDVDDGDEEQEPGRDADLRSRERGGSRRWRKGAEFRPRAESVRDEAREEERSCPGDRRVRRSTSGSRRGRADAGEGLSSEEDEEEELTVERREERPQRRALQRSQSLRCRSRASDSRARSTHAPPGAAVQCLDLVELQQVLRDEELARRLQDEEDRLLVVRRSPQPSSSSRSSYPEGDFRVAQVAQDEEIARFMQKREMTAKRRSRELEGPASWREHREMISHYDRRASRERQGPRERLDSEGLPSPTEDYSPENQPPSPVSTTPQVQHIRNIAEELDPTFKARTQNKDSLGVGQTGPPFESLPLPHPGLPDFMEEPTFIPPTKRPSDKSTRSKAKEKKENCKQQ